MESIEARGRVVGKFGFSKGRGIGKCPAQGGYAGLAVILHRETEEGLLFEIKNKLGLALGHILEIVHLPAAEQRERVNFIPFCEREGIVRLRVGGEFLAVEILKKIDIAQHIDVSRSINVIGKEEPLLESDAVAVGCFGFRRLAGGLYRSHILRLKNIVTAELAEIAVRWAVFHVEVESGGGSELHSLLEANLAIDSLHDRKPISEE